MVFRAVFFLLLILVSCNSLDRQVIPDVSDIEINTRFRRFELALFGLDLPLDSMDVEGLKNEFPEFAQIYFKEILPVNDLNYLEGFLQHDATIALFEEVKETYADLDFFEKDCMSALQYLKHYFPQIEVPHITTYVSEYNVGSFVYGDNYLAVGLDFFLGSDYPYAELNPGNTSFSDYLTRTFNRDHLVLKTLAPLIEDMVGYHEGQNLLELMIHEGKKILIKDKILPFVPDSVIMEVSREQMDWLTANEFDIWVFFLDEKLLYSNDWKKIRKYVEYSPHSPGMPIEAPGRTASFIGWKILESYMKRNPQITLEDILHHKDGQHILDQSRYKPLRR
jgi:hypothetical protein